MSETLKQFDKQLEELNESLDKHTDFFSKLNDLHDKWEGEK